jgi:membrane protein required for colicin V production
MNYIDIILGLLLIVAAIRGFIKGFIYEVASLVALVLGVWGGIHFSYSLADFLKHTFSWNSQYLDLISFFIILVVIIVLVHMAGIALSKIVEAISLGFLDHTAGLLFGIVKAAFILSILLVLIDQFDRQHDFIPEKDKVNSRTYEPLKNFVPTVFPFLNFWDEIFQEQKKENEKVV